MYHRETNLLRRIEVLITGLAVAAACFAGCGTSPETNDDRSGSGVTCADATSESECLAIDGCNPISAWLIDVEKECAGPDETFLACSDDADTCAEAETMGIDPKTGDCYQFANLCLPTGWQDLNGDDEDCASLPICDAK